MLYVLMQRIQKNNAILVKVISKSISEFRGLNSSQQLFNQFKINYAAGLHKLKEGKTHITELLENICQKDDQRSFEELFKLLYERLLSFCIHYVKHRESAEELVSDVFVKLWTKRKNLSHIQNPEVYFFIAVKNCSLNHIKQFSNYRITYFEDEGIHKLINTHDPGKELERKELLFKMDQVVNSLPMQCKIIFNLIKEEGMKYKEVAQILDLSPRTVETQLVRAMKKLDKIITPYLSSSQEHPKNRNKILQSVKSILFSIISFIHL
jgi:RNA polymerase sigma-70 factor (ECF subfamily)